MDAEEEVEPLAEPASNRRTHPRQAVDEPASLIVLKHEATIPCRVVDISLTGCRLRAVNPFLPGLHVRVEVNFKIHGLMLRFNGQAQWTDDCRTVGIRFVDVTARRIDELAEILDEIAAENAAKAKKEAAERATEEALMHAVFQDVASSASEEAGRQPERKPTSLHSIGPKDNGLQPPAMTHPKQSKSERRKQNRQEVDTSAEIHLINIRSSVAGRILDLSPCGCHIRTDERFPVGIYVRVETVFRLRGLPFRLGGVIQAIHDRHNVGIRFIDMSKRKQEYLDQLIEEIEEMRMWHQQVQQGESSRKDKNSSEG